MHDAVGTKSGMADGETLGDVRQARKRWIAWARNEDACSYDERGDPRRLHDLLGLLELHSRLPQHIHRRLSPSIRRVHALEKKVRCRRLPRGRPRLAVGGDA